MKARRLLPFALILALFAVAAPTAGAKAKKVAPALTLTNVKSSGVTISPPAAVSFSPPAGVATSKACKGKVAFSAPTGTKTVKKNGKKVKVTVLAMPRRALRSSRSTASAARAAR
ncbi:MAG: hypothetical protein QM648_11460 [Solirubrobacterales bacterium]